MSATEQAIALRPTAVVIRVRVPPRSWRSELRAMKIVWRRELTRFRNDRIRIVTALVQPLLFLFVLGSGLQQLSSASTDGVDLKTFIYPGILCIAVMFTAMFSAASIVWDREFGFLREMMVAPVRRSSIVIGKCLGGATVASLQGVILLCLAWAVDVPYSVTLILGILALQLLLAFSITAFGVMVAARIKQMTAFMGVMQMVVMPMFFISGALFPVANLPAWLAVLNRLDPLTYAVDPMRRLVFNHLDITNEARAALDPGVTWWGWRVPTLLEVTVVLVLGLAMLGIAIWGFNASEEPAQRVRDDGLSARRARRAAGLRCPPAGRPAPRRAPRSRPRASGRGRPRASGALPWSPPPRAGDGARRPARRGRGRSRRAAAPRSGP
jgi:ABC-2 type transport system permease protein